MISMSCDKHIENSIPLNSNIFFAASCDACQRSNHLRKVPAVLHPIPPPDESFSQFGMDLVGPLTLSASGNRYIIVLTDYLTKWPEAEAIPNKEAKTVAKFLTKIVCRYSKAEVIITDQGREFCNSINEDICKRLGIDHRTTTAYHPQSNGQTERYNQTLCSSILKYVNAEQDNWDDFIDPILLAYRTSIHKTTKKSPYFLAFGMEPKLLIEEQFPVAENKDNVTSDEALENRIKSTFKMFNIQKETKSTIESEQVKHKKYFDLKHQPPTYTVGQLVLVNNARRNQRKGDKLAPRWTGPYEILEKKKKGTFKKKGQNQVLKNACLIKPYKTADAANEDTIDATIIENTSEDSPQAKDCVEEDFTPPPLLWNSTVWIVNGKCRVLNLSDAT